MANHDLSFFVFYLMSVAVAMIAVAGMGGAASVYYASVPVLFCISFLTALIFGSCHVVNRQVNSRLRRGKIGNALLFYRSAKRGNFLLSVLPAILFGIFCIPLATALGERYSYLVILSLLPALVFGSQLGPFFGYLMSVGLTRLVRICLSVLSVTTIAFSLIAMAFLSDKAEGIRLLLRKQELIYVYAGAGLGLGISAALLLTFILAGILCMFVSRELKSQEEPLSIDRDEKAREVLPYYLRLLLPSIVLSLIFFFVLFFNYRVGFATHAGAGSLSFNMNTWGGFAGGTLPILILAAGLILLPFTAMPERFSRAFYNDRKNVLNHEFCLTMRLMGYVGFPISLYLFGAAKPIIQILHAGFGQAAKDGAILNLKLSCGSAFLLALAVLAVMVFSAASYEAVALVCAGTAAAADVLLYLILVNTLHFSIEAVGLSFLVFLLVFDVMALILGRQELLAATGLSYFYDWRLILLSAVIPLVPVVLLNDFMTEEIIPVGGAILLLMLYTVLYVLFSILLQAADLRNVSKIPGGKYVVSFAQLLGVTRK